MDNKALCDSQRTWKQEWKKLAVDKPSIHIRRFFHTAQDRT